MKLDQLFKDEERVVADMHELSAGILSLSEFVSTKTPLDLAQAEVSGKKIRAACDRMNDDIHEAKKELGVLCSQTTSVSFKQQDRLLHEMEDDLALMHGDVETIGRVAEHFFEAPNREAAFENLNTHYGTLVKLAGALLSSRQKLSAIL